MLPKHLTIQNKKKSQVKKGLKGTAKRPRLAVFRSNRYISAQLIDDQKGETIVFASEKQLKKEDLKSSDPKKRAELVGQLLATHALKKKVKNAVFDRGNYKYHGRVKSLAEAARKSGLKI